MPPETERKDLIPAIGKALEEPNIPLEVRETLQAFQLLETGDMGLFQPFEDYETGYFRPAELYEYRVTKILIELLNEITKQENEMNKNRPRCWNTGSGYRGSKL